MTTSTTAEEVEAVAVAAEYMRQIGQARDNPPDIDYVGVGQVCRALLATSAELARVMPVVDAAREWQSWSGSDDVDSERSALAELDDTITAMCEESK